MTKETEETSTAVEEIKKIETELAGHLEKMTDQIEAGGISAAETAKNVETLTQDLVGASEKLTEIEEKRAGEVKTLNGRIDELETKLSRKSDPAGGDDDRLKLPGEIFVKSGELERVKKTGEMKTAPVRMKTLFPERQYKTDLLSTPPTRLVMPARDAMVGAVTRGLVMRDLLPVRPTISNAIEYVREAGFSAGATASVTSIVISSLVATVTTAAAHGMIQGQRVRISGCTSSTGFNADHWIATITSATVFTIVTALADDGGVTGTILFLNLQVHGAAAEIAEGAAKPEAQLDLELLTENVQSIPHWIPASRQVLADAGQLEAYINDRLRYGVEYKEEIQLLYGTGTAPQIQGIMTEAGVLEYLWSSGIVTPVDTKIDAIRRAMTLSHRLEHIPSGVVVNPLDWQDVELAKRSDGAYIWISVTTGGEQRFFLLPVVVTNAITAGEALVGAFATASTLWDREDVNVRVSDSHSDFFVKNMVAILAEERVCQTIHRPDAFTKVTFDAAPS